MFNQLGRLNQIARQPINSDNPNPLLQQILALLLAQVQRGMVWYYEENVSALAIPPLSINPPLFSIVLVNDGATPIQYQIPSDAGNWVRIDAGETHTYSFPTGVITSINRRMVGAASSWRMFGTY